MLHFDEVMTQKASKISLEDKVIELQRKYDPKIADLYACLQTAKAERDQQAANFDKFVNVVNAQIYESVSKICKRSLTKQSSA